MRETYNTRQVDNTLELLLKLLNRHNIEYRFLGSVLMAAINGNVHRELGDLDLIVDKKNSQQLYDSLYALGYRRKEDGMFSFARKFLALETLHHPEYLEIGYFMGTWQKNGSFIIGSHPASLLIDSIATKPESYKLNSLSFIGIPKRAVATGIYFSLNNPKRQKEKQILDDRGIKPMPNNYIHPKILGKSFDFLFHSAMGVLNIIGRIRLKFGLAYDPWR
jgi:hypothetical protein